MIYNFIVSIKNILIKNSVFSLLISKIYLLYNNHYHKRNIDIFKKSNIWVHRTSIGFIPSNKPICDPENYATKDSEIFFEKYMPKKNDIVVELGAGVGCETLFISKNIGENGKIIAVEPFNKIFNYLKETIQLNNLKNVSPVNKAIFETSSISIGFESDLDDWLGGRISTNSKDKVSSINLDDLAKEQNLNKINFCKINIEGAEKYIVKNSDYFFDICDNISIECHDFLEKEEYKTFELIKNFLKSKKYNLTFSTKNNYPWQKYYIYGSK